MKVFYTDLTRKSDRSKLGFKVLKLSVILFVVFLIVLIGSNTIFEIGTTQIMIGFYISMFVMVMFFITFICGLVLASMKISGEEDLRVFVYDNEELYIIDRDGVSNDHFSTFRLSTIGGTDELSILIAINSMLSFNNERKEKINVSRNENEIIQNLKEHKHNRIKDIEILKDFGTTLIIEVRTIDGARRKVSVGNNYYNYEELFNIIRNFGGK